MLKPHLLDHKITFISDRHLGIVSVVSALFPEGNHAYCIYHLINNLRCSLSGTSTPFKEKMVYLFKKCAYASTQSLYKEFMEEFLKEGGRKVASFCDNLPSEKYACSYFKGKKYGSMASTPAESFNNQIKQYCSLPILELVDRIRLLLMSQISRRYGEAERWTSDLCPEFDKKFRANLEKCRPWIVRSSTPLLHEVFCDPVMVVDLSVSTCSCGVWQQDCFPCAHALAAILYIDEDPINYIEPCFFVSSYKATYSYGIPAFTTFGQTSTSTTSPDLLPPVLKRRAGRPKKKRIPSKGELIIRRTMCSCCSKCGHNRRTCVELL